MVSGKLRIIGLYSHRKCTFRVKRIMIKMYSHKNDLFVKEILKFLYLNLIFFSDYYYYPSELQAFQQLRASCCIFFFSEKLTICVIIALLLSKAFVCYTREVLARGKLLILDKRAFEFFYIVRFLTTN